MEDLDTYKYTKKNVINKLWNGSFNDGKIVNRESNNKNIIVEETTSYNCINRQMDFWD